SLKIGGAGYDVSGHPGITVGPGGEVFITGDFQTSIQIGSQPLNSLNFGVFLAKLDPSSRAARWAPKVGAKTSGVSAVAAASDGVVIAGSFDVSAVFDGTSVQQAAGMHDIFVAKYAKDGKPIWGKKYGDTEDQYARSVAVDPNGMVYVTGEYHGILDF